MSERIKAKGHSWDEVRERILTPEERAASNLRVETMVKRAKAKTAKGASLESEAGDIEQPLAGSLLPL